MPLSEGARALIRANLEDVHKGKRVRAIVIGVLTQSQLDAINEDRHTFGYVPVVADVVFLGSHIYRSRIDRDGYIIDDVLDQIENAMATESVILKKPGMAVMKNFRKRADRYGNTVCDEVVFECSARHPRPELFGVVPKGDKIKPKKPLTL